MLKNLMRSIANTIDGIAYTVFGSRSKNRDPNTKFDVKHQRALLIISKPVGQNYDFDYMEDE